jgi:hypothetical protein
MQLKSFTTFIIDLLVVLASFVFCVWLKPGAGTAYFVDYSRSFLFFLLIWVSVSVIFEKYRLLVNALWVAGLKRILLINLIIFFLITSLMYIFQSFNYSRFIVLGTVGAATLVELTFGALFYLVSSTRVKYENSEFQDMHGYSRAKTKEEAHLVHKKRFPVKYDFKQREEYLRNEIGEEAFQYIANYAAVDSPNTLVIATTTRFNIDAQIQHTFECIINVRRVNDFRYINKYFESVNAKLQVGGIFIDFFETTIMRKKRILAKFPPGLNYLYYTADFILKRVFPKFLLTKKLYFILTRGENSSAIRWCTV